MSLVPGLVRLLVLVGLLVAVAAQSLTPVLQDLSIIIANAPQILGQPGAVRCYVVRSVVFQLFGIVFSQSVLRGYISLQHVYIRISIFLFIYLSTYLSVSPVLNCHRQSQQSN